MYYNVVKNSIRDLMELLTYFYPLQYFIEKSPLLLFLLLKIWLLHKHRNHYYISGIFQGTKSYSWFAEVSLQERWLTCSSSTPPCTSPPGQIVHPTIPKPTTPNVNKSNILFSPPSLPYFTLYQVQAMRQTQSTINA